MVLQTPPPNYNGNDEHPSSCLAATFVNKKAEYSTSVMISILFLMQSTVLRPEFKMEQTALIVSNVNRLLYAGQASDLVLLYKTSFPHKVL